MTSLKHRVTIKGVKDGLVFLLDDECDYEELVQELEHKLEKTHQTFLTGPIVHVNVKLGAREVTDKQKTEIRSIIGRQGNLMIQSIESEADQAVKADEKEADKGIQTLNGIVRSGQTLHHEGNLLFMGDVNPGGTLTCTGDIFVMGSLRGLAHAGRNGNEKAIIAASHMKPTQLRIADIISRPPDEWGIGESYMEFAYLKDGKMEIEKIQFLNRIRGGS
ncbi:septum site-determining protein MinC [Paenibacillus turpanensis]|uniref:septum site-determining protein MinC n=1 Tax=Paenibacillus turpanensis TaxID=2689078 RepID=UPI0014088F0A|nr:septum site-determining protein MinC [Paenibacillus turpanensis]